MKIAFCIICHKYTAVLREAVSLLAESNDIYLHVDAKSEIEAFEPLRGMVRFVEPRVNVTWGGYSQIEAYLRAFEATKAKEYGYVALISGDTLPLRPVAEIKKYLADNQGREFVFEKPILPHHRDRVRYKHPAESVRDRGFWLKIARGMQKCLRLRPRNPYFDLLPPLAFGSNWIVITPAFRDYIFDYLAANPHFTEALMHSNCGDELFFATIINQSPFADRRDPRRYMYVDWETGPQYPRTLNGSDFDRLETAAAKNNDEEYYLFARKFADDTDLAEYRRRFIDRK